MPRGLNGANGANGVNGANAAASFASLERTLDRTIDCLTGGTQSSQARALLIEARRLRSVVANWRSIPPPPDVHDEMLDRVLQLSTAVGAQFPEAVDNLPTQVDAGPQPTSAEMTEVGGYGGEATEAYALDFEPHLYSFDATGNRMPRPQQAPPEAGERREPAEDGGIGGKRPRSFPDAQARGSAEPRVVLKTPSPRAGTWPGGVQAPAYDDAPATTRRATPVPPPPAPPPPQGYARPRTQPPPPAEPQQPRPEPRPSPRANHASIHDGAAKALVVQQPTPANYDEPEDLSVPRTQMTAYEAALADPPDPLLLYLTEPYSPRADAYRGLRRKLATWPNVRVLGITSANAGEGKTVFALNLALTLREGARGRVLVIEANLHAPHMGKLLGFPTPECFLAQIDRHVTEPRGPWVVAEPMPKLHVMAIDPQRERKPVLDPVAFSMGMERLKAAGYDYIVIDSPSVLGGVDCNVIADHVDGMILTALPLKSKRKDMRRAVEQLEPAPILGVVVLEG